MTQMFKTITIYSPSCKVSVSVNGASSYPKRHKNLKKCQTGTP